MGKLKITAKRLIIKYGRRLTSLKWPDNGLLNVGIICDGGFSSQEWQNALESNFKDYEKFYNVVFIKNRLQKYILSENINIYFTSWLDKEYLNSAKNLKWVHFPQAGLEFLGDADMKNIKITTSVGLSSKHIAEHVLSFIFMFLRRLDIAIINQIKGQWKQKDILPEIRPMEGITIGICGLGNSGRKVASICKRIGFKVVGFDKQAAVEVDHLDALFNRDKFENFLKEADFVIICLPLNSETLGMFGLKEFQLMKRNAFLINVARGDIILEKDLKEAIKRKIIAGAALDVLSKEPPRYRRNSLQNCKNIVITPHVAGNIHSINKEIQLDFINKLKNYISFR